jgi:hypothetical protein
LEIFNPSLSSLYTIFTCACYPRIIEKEQNMFFMWIVPLALIVLIVYALSRGNLANAFQPAAGRACPHCNQAVQNDWKNCPHCGQTL